MFIRFLIPLLPLVFLETACAVSLRAQAAGTVRSMTNLGIQGGLSAAAGRPAGKHGLLLAGLDANAGAFGRNPAGDGSAKIEYLRFSSRYAWSFSLHAGERFSGDDRGFIVIAQGIVLEPFPRSNPAGYLGATLWFGWGTGDDSVRGGILGVGLLWEFCDLFRWSGNL